MMKKILLLIFILLSVQGNFVFAAEQIGVAKESLGYVQVVDKSGTEKSLRSGNAVYLGDMIETGERSSLEIRFRDETIFAVGPESRVTLDEYIYQPGKSGGEINIHFLKGVFRLMTGKMALSDPGKMEIKLPEGTVGIRGTTLGGRANELRSMIVLLPSESRFFAADHIGHIILSNIIEGELKTTHIQETGYGSLIEGKGKAPTAAFKIPEKDIDLLMGKFALAKRDATERSMNSVFKEYLKNKSNFLVLSEFRSKADGQGDGEKLEQDSSRKAEEPMNILIMGDEDEESGPDEIASIKVSMEEDY